MTYPPLRLGSRGAAVEAAKIAINRWDGRHGNTSRVYGPFFTPKVKAFQRAFGIQPTGKIGQATWKQLERYFNADCKRLLGIPVVPDLGPVTPGGTSVLDHDLTHPTSGLDLYPAFDDAFGEGRLLIAPEDIVITKTGHSNPGRSCFADGASGISYWFGHLVEPPPVGARIRKGGTIGRTCRNTIGGGPHGHVGINVERLIGTGRQLVHHTDYTNGAPTVRQQLEAWSRT